LYTEFTYLKIEDIEYIIDKELNRNEKNDNHILEERINQAIDWDLELVCLNYFLTRILDKENKINSDKTIDYQNIYFDLENKMGIIYEEFNNDFIISLFDEEQNESLNLEEQLIETTKKIYNKRYW
jgi:hypothetical protein